MRISDLIAYTAFRWRLWRASRRMKKAVIGYAETREKIAALRHRHGRTKPALKALKAMTHDRLRMEVGR